MKIICTGANGQLGRKLRDLATHFPAHQLVPVDIEELDITQKEQVTNFIRSAEAELLVNAAAYTSVDKAEEEPTAAYAVNSDGVRNLVEAASQMNIPLIHISTDYVFDGHSWLPYTEDAAVNPLSTYAKTKAEGEEHPLGYAKGYIVRTSWLYSEYGHNFVKTMIRLAEKNTALRVVYDQTGSPTYAHDLALALWMLIEQINSRPLPPPGLYHYSNEGVASWYDLAVMSLQLAGIKGKIEPVRTEEYPLPAKRPQHAVLDKSKIKHTLNIQIPHWTESLRACIEILKKA